MEKTKSNMKEKNINSTWSFILEKIQVCESDAEVEQKGWARYAWKPPKNPVKTLQKMTLGLAAAKEMSAG